MAHADLEKWVCQENIDRFRVGLKGEADQQKLTQLQDLLSQELLKIEAMFPG